LVAEEVCRLQQRGVERMNCNVVLKLLQVSSIAMLT
jgi:hypothetical protein